jgi:hypothetical protein
MEPVSSYQSPCPLLSVVVLARRADGTVAAALRSVQAQTGPVWEAVVAETAPAHGGGLR